MKKTILSSGAFLLILALLILGIGQLLERIALKIDPDEPKVRVVFSLKGESFNTLFLGSSIAQQGFNPQVIDSIAGVNSYNLAIGGASIFEMELLLRHYLLHNAKPDRIIYGIYVNEKEWPDKIRPSVLQSLDPEIVQRHYATNEEVDHNMGLAFYHQFKIFKYRNVLQHSLKYLYDKKSYSYQYYKGFIIRHNIAHPLPKYPGSKGGNNIKALKRFVEYCTSISLPILFVELPNYQVFNAATLNRDSLLNELHEIPQFRNAYLDMNHPEKYSSKHWAGLNHLNYAGASLFSREFALELSKWMDGEFIK